MRYTWSEEQRLLRDTVERYVIENLGFAARRDKPQTPRAAWRDMASLGLLGVAFDERYGGGGGSPLDTVLVMEAFGRGPVVEPYVSTVVLGGGVLRHAGDEALKAELIPKLIAGDTLFSFAYAEPRSRFNLANVELRAQTVGNGYELSGQKIVVYGGPEADVLFVSARTAGDTRDRDGISLFMVPADAAGVSRQDYQTMDGLTASEIAFDRVRVPAEAIVGEPGGALPTIERVIDDAIVAVCAEAVGAMSALNERCVEYCKTRVAFGQPISKFQVVQHRLVDMHVAYEQVAALTLRAALALDQDPVSRGRAVAAAKVQLGQDAVFVGKNGVQLHGAIGMTEDLDVGHFFKRITMINSLFGPVEHQLRRYRELRGHNEGAARGH
ncbi:acyl-CoA dehydrogenase [Phenylobacterium sp. SCN 70-31]|uniref:acyl-CoA dehydrogenase family protein n=1 Tax=Phenylobacterium sp. SCN 70-31 TaxID=1660129 RepID=UPI00086A2744|nr:acyl-CoA dehydrogenase [Phenylobacterium sp. SCN 70-31]ODT88531.1 MAG: hypothetical protein ABS78_06725 [Phenylobacterium sp. SCN 70-31]